MNVLKKKSLLTWLKSGEYLPECIRDFHDQKDLFRHVEEMVDKRPIPQGDTWIGRHVFVIDYFLWFMARHGYTLQRSRQPIEFEDYGRSINEWRERQASSFAEMLNRHITEQKRQY